MQTPEQKIAEHPLLLQRIAALEAQVSWFKKQFFGGGKSEKLDLSQRFLRESPGHHRSEELSRWFLLIAARLLQSGRQKEVQVSIRGGWAEQLRDGHLRLHEWIRTTAPQLKPVTPLPA